MVRARVTGRRERQPAARARSVARRARVACRPRRRCASHSSSSARPRAADPRIRNVESASYGDSLAEAALANSLGVEAYTRRTTCSASAVALADDGSGAQTGYGFVAGRTLADLDLDSIPRDAAIARVPAARRQARSPAGAFPVILDPLVTRSVLGVLSSAFNGESMLKGRSLFAGRVGERDRRARSCNCSTIPPTRVRSAQPSSTAKASRRAATRSSSTACCRGSCTTCTPVGAPARARPRARRAALGRRPVSVCARCGSSRDANRREQMHGRRVEALYVQSVSGLHSGTNPISGDFSVGADGLMVRGRRVRRAGARGHDRVDVAAHAARHRRHRRRPHVPARRGRGHDGARRRDDAQRRVRRRASAALEDRVELGESRPRGRRKCTASMPYARAAAMLSALSSTNTASPGVMLMRSHVSS